MNRSRLGRHGGGLPTVRFSSLAQLHCRPLPHGFGFSARQSKPAPSPRWSKPRVQQHRPLNRPFLGVLVVNKNSQSMYGLSPSIAPITRSLHRKSVPLPVRGRWNRHSRNRATGLVRHGACPQFPLNTLNTRSDVTSRLTFQRGDGRAPVGGSIGPELAIEVASLLQERGGVPTIKSSPERLCGRDRDRGQSLESSLYKVWGQSLGFPGMGCRRQPYSLVTGFDHEAQS
jgi:hypothetical protein